MAIVVKHPSIFVYATPDEGKTNKYLLISLGVHFLFVAVFWLAGPKSLQDMINMGEVIGFDEAPSTEIVQEIELEEIPPPPVVDIPEFVKPEEVVVKPPEPEKPKPTPVPQLPRPSSPVRAPVYAATKPVAGNSDFPRPPYPYEAKKRRIQGSVLLLVTYGTSGAVTECTVVTSSGYSILDTAARNWIKSRWNFRNAAPGRSGSVQMPYKFELITN